MTTPATLLCFITLSAALMAAFYAAPEPCPVVGGYPNDSALCGLQSGQKGHGE